MGISFLISEEDLEKPRVRQMIEELQNPNKEFIRVPGESRSGICEFCAQYIFVRHDRSGREVPLPIVGTHENCVCNDIPLPIFKIGTKSSLASAFDFPDEGEEQLSGQKFKYPIRRAKKGEVKRFEWLNRQSRRTKELILGSRRAGFLKDIKIEALFNRRTGELKPIDKVKKNG